MTEQRLIDADHFKKRVMPKCQFPTSLEFEVDSEPTIDAVTVVHGHWISIDEDIRGFAEEFECSVCKRDITLSYYDTDCDYAYCPHCGAKMDEKDGEQDDSD